MELASSAAAKAAMDAEWLSLRIRKAWDENLVREWADVREEARRTGCRTDVGMVSGICVEKVSTASGTSQSEVQKAIFRGTAVRDEDHYAAAIQDLGSSPASMSAAKFVDFIGLLPGCCTTLADAIRAYCQALLVGVPTWVLPRDQWPASWSKMKDPVAALPLRFTGTPTREPAGNHSYAKLSEN